MSSSSIAMRLESRQQQTLSPRLQQAVRLLQLSSLDFAREVQQVLGRNPFLETDEVDPVLDSAMAPPQAVASLSAIADEPLPAAADAVDTPLSASLSVDDSADTMAPPIERDSWQADGLGSTRRSDDGETSALDLMAVPTSLADHLHGQLNVQPLDERDLCLAKAVVESLDEDGYLRTDLSELIEATGLEPRAEPDELQIALRRVQALDPSGVGARDVRECLLLQLDAIDDAHQRELARAIVSEHLEALAANDVNGLARRLSQAPATIEAACDRIRRLDPRPGWRFGSTPVQYVIPDVIARRTRDGWTATLNPSVVPRVRLNQFYAELFHRHRNRNHGELAASLQEARWTLKNVEQRFATILTVSQAILDRQGPFLDYGALAMKPLGLREIAAEVGLHESTVSRVTNNKYMATPSGVYELKHFFCRALDTANGGAASATAIRGVIQDMIAAEDPTRPLSDAEIARQLAQQGLLVARRTVTKYRQMLRIEPVDRRRRLG